MNALLARLLVRLAAPIKLLDMRAPTLERLLQLSLSDEDVRFVRHASSRRRIGAYYHWYLQKLFVANAVKGTDKEGAIALIKAIDRTDYSLAQALVDSRSGALVAIPHHAHYVLTMTALACHVGKHRKVKVFYSSPATNKGNAAFDRLHTLLFSDPALGVEIIHNTRQGLGQAIKALRNGEVLFIMPDAYDDITATMLLPFCGALTPAMLGTAILARKTGAWILPVVSRSVGHGLGFDAHFGTPIRPTHEHRHPEEERVADYAVMRQVFAQFEGVMACELLLWQNVRKHGADEGMPKALAARADLQRELAHLQLDPLFRAPDIVLDLRTPAPT